MPLMSSTITAHLELVLSKSGELIHGPTDLTVSIVGPNSDVRWSETHENIPFYNGVVSFEIGTISEIKTFYFFDKGVQLTVTVGDDTISLPMYSTPFSMFSHAADVVNAIHMEGVFHTDLINKRIGINIDVPTPSVRLEVNGAVRLGDDANIDEIGAIRWRNNRLEGRHNHAWKYLDVSPADGFESKWEDNNDNVSPAFYVNGTSVLVATTDVRATLTVTGAGYVDQRFQSGGHLVSTGRLNLLNDYGVSLNAAVYARSVTLNATNYYNFTDGLTVSGILSGKGHGISDIQASNLRTNAIQNNELADFSIGTTHIQDDAVTNSTIKAASISRDKLHSSFKLSNDYFLPQIVTNNKIKRNSVHEDDLSLAFQLMAFHFMDKSVVSRNISAGEIDSIKIKDNELDIVDFSSEFIDQHSLMANQLVSSTNIKDGVILADDFLAGSLSYGHFSSLISIDKGGTNQSVFGDAGELIVASNNQLISESRFVLTNTGLGINNNNPLVRLDIHQSSGLQPLRIRSNQASPAGMLIKNDIGQWFVGLTATSNIEIYDQLNLRRMFAMDRSNGHIGLKMEPSTEIMTVNGGVVLGDKSVSNGLSLKAGSMYFSHAENKFKLRTDLGVSSLDLGPVLPHELAPSSLYVHHVLNDSVNSRVLLGEQSQLMGDGHGILGAFDSLIDGDDQDVNFMYSSILSGASSYARFLTNSQLIGTHLLGSFLTRSSVFGDHHSLHFLTDSVIDGDGHHVRFLTNGDIDGDGHQLSFSESLHVTGRSHTGTNLDNVHLSGTQHSVDRLNDAYLYGARHVVSNSSHVSVDGERNTVSRSDFSVVSGGNNLLDGAKHSVLIGNDNHIVQASGMYLGSSNRHYGAGAPLVTGNNNRLFGSFDGHVSANSLVSIGTSDADLMSDYSIHFHAPGGVDVVSGEIALAHLAPNAGSWSHVSDKDLKINVEPLDPKLTLSKVIELPVMEWSYKGQHYVQHIGPMAQDFYSLFKLGDNDRYIQSVDMDGVIFSSIQGLGNVMKQVKDGYSNLSEKERSVGIGLSGMSTALSSIQVSGNQLVEMNTNLNFRFDDLYKKESEQLKVIEALNKDIAHIKKRMEAKK